MAGMMIRMPAIPFLLLFTEDQKRFLLRAAG